MFVTRLLVSMLQFVLNVVIYGFVIYYTYRIFIKANKDFDMEDEIRKGNVAVGILVGSILLSASMILYRSLASVSAMIRMFVSSPGEYTLNAFQIGLIAAAHLGLTMCLAVLTISITLRLFGKMLRPRMRAGKELEKGNIAVGLLLACAVAVASVYIGDGIGAVSKAMVPQPSVGQIEVMK